MARRSRFSTCREPKVRQDRRHCPQPHQALQVPTTPASASSPLATGLRVCHRRSRRDGRDHSVLRGAGVPTPNGADLLSQSYTGTSQAVRPGGLFTATVTNSNATGSQLITASGGDQSWAVNILPGHSHNRVERGTGGIPHSIHCQVRVRPSVVTRSWTQTIPGLVKTTTATQTVRITP